MHVSVERFIGQYEEEAIRSGSYRKKLGKAEVVFLQEVWGPAFQFRFDGLRAEFPFKDFKGGDRLADFVYIREGVRLAIEIDGFTTHARDISPGDFSDHLLRQNDLVLAGWMLLRFSAYQVERQPMLCQRQIKQAIGHWWFLSHQVTETSDVGVWPTRRKTLVSLAMRHDGCIRPADVQDACGVPHRTGLNWLRRFAAEGVFVPIKSSRRIVGYRLLGR